MQMLLAVAFVAGAVLYAAYPDPRDEAVRRTGVLIMAGAASVVLLRISVRELMGHFKSDSAAAVSLA